MATEIASESVSPFIPKNGNPKELVEMESEEGEEINQESRKREEWSSPVEFLFSCLALSIGIGNIWRFPYTCYKNGGGAFLIPYMIVLFFIGRPLYFLELAWGQFSSFGQVKAWEAVPLLKGVGYAELIASICGGSYYCAIMALALFYLIQSFNSILPWTVCKPEWNVDCGENRTESFAELYFQREVVGELENIDEGIGIPDWRLALCLFGVWCLIFLTVIRGIKSSGKASFFFALFPYFVLFVLLIRGLTLPGSWEGIYYFIKPEWGKIMEPGVWYAAISQCFFSLSIGFGSTIMNASYNSFYHKVHRDAYIINLVDAFTSLLAGVTIFATLGNLAQELGVDISQVAKSGPGLVFFIFPSALSKFQYSPQFFSVLFFSMLLSLGVGTATGIVNGVICVTCDEFPNFKRIIVTIIVCICGFCIGLIYVCPGGQFLITLVDHFGAGAIIYIMATLEIIGIAWFYGLDNFCKDVEFMLKIKVGWFLRFCWIFIVPISLITVFVYTLVNSTTLTHSGVQFPELALAFGWTLSALAVSIVPLFAIKVVINSPGSTFKKKLCRALSPSKEWGPRDRNTKLEWTRYKSK